MNALSLYKFIEAHSIEWHWNKHENKEDVIIFINSWDLKEWFKLMKGNSILDDEGITCVMKDGYMCFWMRDICEYIDLNIEEIFDKSKEL